MCAHLSAYTHKSRLECSAQRTENDKIAQIQAITLSMWSCLDHWFKIKGDGCSRVGQGAVSIDGHQCLVDWCGRDRVLPSQGDDGEKGKPFRGVLLWSQLAVPDDAVLAPADWHDLGGIIVLDRLRDFCHGGFPIWMPLRFQLASGPHLTGRFARKAAEAAKPIRNLTC